ncbi:MAG: hypothetical protein FJ038_01225 [Chloroflexi bacterium]|nr:hypothetical protein [Chloroflexota bacterium]
MATSFVPQLAVASVAGIIGGLGLLWRGLGAMRNADRIADTAGSRVASLAVGEVRLTGIVEPAELLLTSPLQSRPCIWYRASVRERRGDDERTIFSEERAVGFRLRDETGSVRVFPRGGHWAVGDRFTGSTGLAGDEPPGLAMRSGPAIDAAELDRDEQIRRLLTVTDPRADDGSPLERVRRGSGPRRYREARIEPSDVITLVGFVEPFDQLPDPAGADSAESSGLLTDGAGGDEAIAADLAEARAAGLLAPDAETAWGNAAIPGFGIGLLVRAPDLDPEAQAPLLAEPAVAARIERTFAIAPEDLIVAARADIPLLISEGTAGAAAAHHQSRFLLGILGAVLAIGSSIVLALTLTGGLLI